MSFIGDVAAYLYKKGDRSTLEIAQALNVTAERVIANLKSDRGLNSWGVYKTDKVGEKKTCGKKPAVWTVNRKVYQARIKKDKLRLQKIEKANAAKAAAQQARAKKAAEQQARAAQIAAKQAIAKASFKEPKVIYGRLFPVYKGPYKTLWQASSPYKTNNITT